MPKPTNLLSIRLALTDKKEVLEAIGNANSEHSIRIATINPEFIVEAQKNLAFKAALEKMDYCTVDGSGIKMALAFFRHIPTELYHGATMVHDLFTAYRAGEKRFYLLGDLPGVASIAQENLKKLFPKISIVGAEDGGQVDADNIQIDEALITRLTKAQPDILLVAFGAPKQELWINAARNLPIPVMIGIGGTLGFYGTKKRAPQLWQTLYLEWLYRALFEPGHAKRAFRAVIIFPLQALWWKVTNLRITD